MKILVLGGYGTFGGRLVELLSADPRLTLVIAGRSESKAQSFIKTLMPGAEKIALAFDRDADRDSDLDSQISAIKPELVVDATGPFQFYGASPYRVVEACLRQKVNYLDLADGAQSGAKLARYPLINRVSELIHWECPLRLQLLQHQQSLFRRIAMHRDKRQRNF